MGEDAATTGLVFLIGAFIISYFYYSSLNRVLGQVRNIGILSHFMIIKLEFPASQLGFFKGVFPLTTFDVMPDEVLEPIYDTCLPAEDDGPFSEAAKYLGYESNFIV